MKEREGRERETVAREGDREREGGGVGEREGRGREEGIEKEVSERGGEGG